MRERVMKWLQIKRYNWKNYDIFLIAVVLILTFISSYVISIVNSDISLKRQLVGVVMGIVIIGIFSIIDYHDLCMYIPIIYIVTTLMAMATRLTPLGVELDTNSYRWLDFKVFTFQPSEVCKITLILALATFFSKRKENLSTYKNFFLASLILGHLSHDIAVRVLDNIPIVLVFLVALQDVGFKVVLGVIIITRCHNFIDTRIVNKTFGRAARSGHPLHFFSKLGKVIQDLRRNRGLSCHLIDGIAFLNHSALGDDFL